LAIYNFKIATIAFKDHIRSLDSTWFIKDIQYNFETVDHYNFHLSTLFLRYSDLLAKNHATLIPSCIKGPHLRRGDPSEFCNRCR